MPILLGVCMIYNIDDNFNSKNIAKSCRRFQIQCSSGILNDFGFRWQAILMPTCTIPLN
jgi:hypothetical protein